METCSGSGCAHPGSGFMNVSVTSESDVVSPDSLVGLVLADAGEWVSSALLEEVNAFSDRDMGSTLSHSILVSLYAAEIFDAYMRSHSVDSGMSRPDIVLAGLLHDLGKLYVDVPLDVMEGIRQISDEEYSAIKSHPVLGYDKLKRYGLSEDILLGVRNHHERLDGSGYPDGLKGHEIPLSARMIAVADAYDRLTQGNNYVSRRFRPYSPLQALDVLREDKGHFDPDVLDALELSIRSSFREL